MNKLMTSFTCATVLSMSLMGTGFASTTTAANGTDGANHGSLKQDARTLRHDGKIMMEDITRPMGTTRPLSTTAPADMMNRDGGLMGDGLRDGVNNGARNRMGTNGTGTYHNNSVTPLNNTTRNGNRNGNYRATNTTTTNGNRNNSNWGWLGLLGLIGLAGMRNKSGERH